MNAQHEGGRKVETETEMAEDRADDQGETWSEHAVGEGAGDTEEDWAEDAAMHIADAEAAGVVEEDPEDDLEASLTQALAERDELRDRLMRALAETENVRKRAERDVKDAQAYGGTRLARDLLDVYDNLGRALEAADETTKAAAGPVIEGVELTRRALLAAFEKHKIETVTPELGDKFDPKLHQAMFEAPVPDAQPGTVIQVMQSGFTIAGRLLRPAMVGVSAKG